MNDDTIAAIATPEGHGGIGIIRISGPHADAILTKLFRPAKRRSSKERPKVQSIGANYRGYYGHIVDPQNDDLVDEVIALVMKAPNSYTKEDVVEIQAHGGPLVLKSILRLVTRQGARLAKPGEFSYRAFLNGRIDLSQAEAIIDIINARNLIALKSAENIAKGELKNAIEAIIASIDEAVLSLEVDIEFPDEGHLQISPTSITQTIHNTIGQPLDRLIALADQYIEIERGFRIVILGKPNVGKSSLLNAILNKERAIVSSKPGTTRDFIEETIYLENQAITVADCAGLRENAGSIEKIGIEKALQLAQAAELILFVVDATETNGNGDRWILEQIDTQKTLFIYNKIDLLGSPPIHYKNPIEAPWPAVAVSAKTGQGIKQLLKGSVQLIDQKRADLEGSTFFSQPETPASFKRSD